MIHKKAWFSKCAQTIKGGMVIASAIIEFDESVYSLFFQNLMNRKKMGLKITHFMHPK